MHAPETRNLERLVLKPCLASWRLRQNLIRLTPWLRGCKSFSRTRITVKSSGLRDHGTCRAEWVRPALESARRQEPVGSIGKKLDAIGIAVRHEYPSGEVEDMLAQIETGYGSDMRS